MNGAKFVQLRRTQSYDHRHRSVWMKRKESLSLYFVSFVIIIMLCWWYPIVCLGWFKIDGSIFGRHVKFSLIYFMWRCMGKIFIWFRCFRILIILYKKKIVNYPEQTTSNRVEEYEKRDYYTQACMYMYSAASFQLCFWSLVKTRRTPSFFDVKNFFI